MHLDKIVGLARVALGPNRSAWTMLSQGAGVLRGQNPDAVLAQPAEASSPVPAGAAAAARLPWEPEPAPVQPAQPAAAGPRLPWEQEGPAQQPPARPAAAASGLDDDDIALLRVMIAAAQADGHLAFEEQNAILEQAQRIGATPPQIQQLRAEMGRRSAVRDIVSSVDSMTVRKYMYRFAFSIVKSDQRVDPNEVKFLTDLAEATEISHTVLARIVQ